MYLGLRLESVCMHGDCYIGSIGSGDDDEEEENDDDVRTGRLAVHGTLT